MVHLSHLYMATGKTIALTIRTFVSKVMSLLFNMLFRFVIAFLPRNKHLLISWQQSSLVSQTVNNLPAICEPWIQSLGQKDPLEKGMATHSSIFAGEFHGQRKLAGYSPWGSKEWNAIEWLTLFLPYYVLKVAFQLEEAELRLLFSFIFSDYWNVLQL